ncbi:unnamed protein product, partial [Closterium sp. Naga37s-1]
MSSCIGESPPRLAHLRPRRHIAASSPSHRRLIAATSPPHRRHIAALSPPHRRLAASPPHRSDIAATPPQQVIVSPSPPESLASSSSTPATSPPPGKNLEMLLLSPFRSPSSSLRSVSQVLLSPTLAHSFPPVLHYPVLLSPPCSPLRRLHVLSPTASRLICPMSHSPDSPSLPASFTLSAVAAACRNY